MSGSNATLGGTGPLTVGSNLGFDAGTISGITVNTNALQLDKLNSQSNLNDATINVSGNSPGWTQQSSFIAQGVRNVTILPGAQFSITAVNTGVSGGAPGTATLGSVAGGTFQFNNSGTMTVGIGSLGYALFVIGNGVTLNNTGTLTTNPGRISVSAGGTINNSGSFSISPSGSGVLPGQLSNAGTIATLGGTFSVPDGATLTDFNSGLLSGGGTWRAVNASFNFGTRAITSIAAGTTVELNGSATFPALNSLVQNTGTLRVLGGAAFVPLAPSMNTNGTIEVGSGSVFNKGITVQSGGVLTGAGTVGGAVTVQAGGRITPGSGVGTLTVNAPVTVTGGTGTNWDITFVGVSSNTPATASTQASQIALTPATLNLAATSANKITLNLTAAGGTVPWGQPVSYVIATATTGSSFQSNGGAFAFDPNQFAVTTAWFGGVDSFSLLVVNNTLVFQFVPVPEPIHIFGVGGLTLAARAVLRRRPTVAG
jgi:hypothetical protein